MNSARFTAGHFFSRASAALLALLITGGCGKSAPIPVRYGLPQGGETTVLVEFPQDTAGGMPEAVAQLNSTSTGRFHIFDGNNNVNLLQDIAIAVDSAGLLMLAVLPEGQIFPASRDHLKIWIDENGLPVHFDPVVETNLFEDSLWFDPVVRQNTILQLIDLFKPDLVLICMTSAERSDEITAFWSEKGPAEDITIGLLTMPREEIQFRGWGILTGVGIQNSVLEGMTLMDFKATIFMLIGLEWTETGYLTVQAFTTAEDQ